MGALWEGLVGNVEPIARRFPGRDGGDYAEWTECTVEPTGDPMGGWSKYTIFPVTDYWDNRCPCFHGESVDSLAFCDGGTYSGLASLLHFTYTAEGDADGLAGFKCL